MTDNEQLGQGGMMKRYWGVNTTFFRTGCPIGLGHRWPDLWILKTGNLSRSTIVQNVLLLGQLGRQIENSIITSNIQKYDFFVINTTNLIHTFTFTFIRVQSFDMFWASLAHLQEALHRGSLVSVVCTQHSPNCVCVVPAEDGQVMPETYRGFEPA
jgi:hypothetical protein